MADLKHSKVLFTAEDGSSVRFYMVPCDERKNLKPLIEHGGGCISNQQPTDSIRLLPDGTEAQSDGMVKSSYILDCVKANKLLKLSSYKMRKGECVLTDIDMGSEAKYIIKAQAKDRRGRAQYFRDEQLAMLKYLLDEGMYLETKGNTVWRDMARKQVTKHSWQSMKDHFHKSMLPKIRTFDLSAADIGKLTGDWTDVKANAEEDSDADGNVDRTNALSSTSRAPRTSSVSPVRQAESSPGSSVISPIRQSSQTTIGSSTSQGFSVSRVADQNNSEEDIIISDIDEFDADLLQKATEGPSTPRKSRRIQKQQESPQSKKAKSPARNRSKKEESPARKKSKKEESPARKKSRKEESPARNMSKKGESPARNKSKNGENAEKKLRPSTYDSPRKQVKRNLEETGLEDERRNARQRSTTTSTTTSQQHNSSLNNSHHGESEHDDAKGKKKSSSVAEKTDRRKKPVRMDGGSGDSAAGEKGSKERHERYSPRAVQSARRRVLSSDSEPEEPDVSTRKLRDIVMLNTQDTAMHADTVSSESDEGAVGGADVDKTITLCTRVCHWLKVEPEELLDAVYQTNGSLKQAVNYILHGKTDEGYHVWSHDDDAILQNGTEDDMQEVDIRVGSEALLSRQQFLAEFGACEED